MSDASTIESSPLPASDAAEWLPPRPVSGDPETPRVAGLFPQTRWSLVLAAGREQPDALARFCRMYWRPVKEFFRRLGEDDEGARECAQAFFLERVFEKRDLGRVRPGGSFAAWLKQAVHSYLQNDRRAKRRRKRGGHLERVSYDADGAGAAPQQADGTPSPADLLLDTVWDQCWAREVVNRALDRLRRAAGPRWREGLVSELVGELGDFPPDSTARAIESSPDSEWLAARRHKLRREFRECVRQEVRAQLPRGASVDAELRRLHLALLSRQEPPATLAALSSTQPTGPVRFDESSERDFSEQSSAARSSPFEVVELR